MLRRLFHTSSARLGYPLSKNGKPLTPYMAFASTVRKEIMAENPDLKVPELGAKLGEKWRALSDSERKYWAEEYNKVKAPTK